MANFSPKPIDVTQINGGNKYEANDGISPTAVNAPIEAALLVQSLATLAPIVTEIAYEESPRVEIEGTEPRFHFYLPSNKAPTNWRDIRTLVRKGEIRNYLSVGDQIETTWNGYELLLDVIGVNVDTPSDSTYTNSLTLQFHDIIAERPYATMNTGNWTQSEIYAWLHGEFLLGLEEGLRNVIARVNKTTSTDYGSQQNSTDLVFLLSTNEVTGGYPYYYSTSTPVASRDKQSIVVPTSLEANEWWLRDWDGSAPSWVNAWHIQQRGAASIAGVCPAFCIW